MEEAVTALLLADARVRYLMSDRVHWGRLPQGVSGRPYVILQVISGIPDNTNSGESGLEVSRLQVDGYGDSALTARDAAQAVTDVLRAFKGTVLGIRIQGGFVLNKRDFQTDAVAGSQKLFRRSIDIQIWHSS